MCKEQTRPNLKDIAANLGKPMPLGRKISLVLKNNFLKIRHWRNCCGHAGEPGC